MFALKQGTADYSFRSWRRWETELALPVCSDHLRGLADGVWFVRWVNKDSNQVVTGDIQCGDWQLNCTQDVFRT